MNFDDYQTQAASTAIYPYQGEVLGLVYASLGLSGEAGEVSNKVKKIIRDGVYDQDAIIDEVSDVFWYLAQCCTELGVTMSEVAEHNLHKLAHRAERGTIGGNGDHR